MSQYWHTVAIWTMHSLLAGGMALFLSWLALRRVNDPERRHRIAAWSLRASVFACVLTLFPAWLTIPVPGWKTPVAEVEVAMESEPTLEPQEVTQELAEEWVWVPVGEMSNLAHESPSTDQKVTGTNTPHPNPPPQGGREQSPAREGFTPALLRGDGHPLSPSPLKGEGWGGGDGDRSPLSGSAHAETPDSLSELAPIALIPYGCFVAFFLLRQLVGHIGLARMRRVAKPASAEVLRLADEIANGERLPQILISERLASPVCYGVLRPTILLPKLLVKTASANELRWVLAHELDHLRRGDPRTGVWLGIARAVFFLLPWFWAVRRELNLAQEYLADEAAAGSQQTEYAAFLVELSSGPGVPRSLRALPSLAGVRAGQSDLYRRVTMLLEPKSNRKSRWGTAWSATTIAAAVSTAVLLSGIKLIADDEKPKKVIIVEEKKVEVKTPDGQKPRGVIIVTDQSADGKKPDGQKPKEFLFIADDKPADGKKPAEVRKVEVKVVDGHKADGKKPDGQKPKEFLFIADDKPADGKKPAEVRRVDVMVVDGHKADTAEIEKAIEEAAKKGDVEGVKKLVAKLKAATGAATVKPATVTVKEVPVQPGATIPPRVAAIQAARDVETQALEKAIQKLKQAAEEVKDQPEAKAALEKSIEAYRQKIAEAKQKGDLKAAEVAVAKAEAARAEGAVKQWQAAPRAIARVDDAHRQKLLGELSRQMDELKVQMDKRLGEIKDRPEVADLFKKALKEHEATLQELRKNFDQGKLDGVFQFQGQMLAGDGAKLKPLQELATAPSQGRLGITIEAVPAVVREQLDLPKGQGVVVTSVAEGSAAAKAGLKANDILLTVAGQGAQVENLPKIIAGLKAGNAFDMDLIRKGKKETTKAVTLPEVKSDNSTINSSSMTVSVNDDQFTITVKENNTTIEVVGNVNEKSAATVTISQGGGKKEYKGLKSLPENLRPKVEKLLNSVSGK